VVGAIVAARPRGTQRFWPIAAQAPYNARVACSRADRWGGSLLQQLRVRVGLVSLVLGVASVVFAYVANAGGSFRNFSSMRLVSPGLAVAGLALGLIGLARKDTKRHLAILGTALSALVLIVTIIVMGIVLYRVSRAG
jgi:hypothetical protein